MEVFTMGTITESLYAPIAIKNTRNKNIDPRYFKDNEDGTFTPTPLFIYNIARDAEAYFKQRIFDLDEDNQYHTESLREVKDKWAEKQHNAQWKLKYGELTKEANKRWYAYRDAHPDEFETRYKRIDIGGEDEARFFAGYSPDVKVGLGEAVKAYNAARELLARFASPDKDTGEAGPEYSSLPFEEPLYSKEAFVETHKAVRAKISEELGIPNDDFAVGKVEKMVPRINNKKCAVAGQDDTSIEPFVKGLIKHVTSTTAQDFKKAAQEMITFLDKDFTMNFNDSATELKAVEGVNESITIYAKQTDDTSATKLIVIDKAEATDENFRFSLSAVSDDGTSIAYRKTVATKADLRKAMEISVDMLGDDASLKKYCADIKKALENL